MTDGPDYKPTPSVGMPAQPTTKQLPAMTDRALLEDLARVVKSTENKVDNITTSVDVLTNQQIVFGQRLTLVERRQDDADQRQNTHSGGARELADVVRGESAVNLKQDAAMADIINRVDRVETKLDQNSASTELIRAAVTGVGGFLKQNPHVVTALASFIFAALGAAAAHFAH